MTGAGPEFRGSLRTRIRLAIAVLRGQSVAYRVSVAGLMDDTGGVLTLHAPFGAIANCSISGRFRALSGIESDSCDWVEGGAS